MGNAATAHNDLIHVRGWTKQQITSAIETLRRKSMVYRLTKEEFARYFGGRNREVVTIFYHLDTDYDGLVDIFEILTVLIVWSGVAWEEKQDILFSVFDLMGKGFLKIDELILMGTVLVQTLAKFMDVEPEFTQPATLQKLAYSAMPHKETKLTPDSFRMWVKKCEPLERLRGFVEDHAARGLADTNASRMRMQLASLDRHSSKLCDRVERLQNVLQDFTDACVEYVSAWGRKKRWDFLMQNMRHLVVRLQRVSDNMHGTLAELEHAIREEELSGGMAALVQPQRRVDQERALSNLDKMREESLTDFGEATDLLERLIELTEPTDIKATIAFEATGGAHDSLHAIAEAENEGLLDVSPPRVTEHREMMRKVQLEMRADMQEGGCFYRKPMEDVPADVEEDSTLEAPQPAADAGRKPPQAAADQPATREVKGSGATTSSAPPVLVAIADFDPPPSHQSQLLKLRVGEKVTVLGQDGRGWWYGRKEDLKEGWFPPSYVQLEAAHFSSGKQTTR